jgi:hypothetical protein
MKFDHQHNQVTNSTQQKQNQLNQGSLTNSTTTLLYPFHHLALATREAKTPSTHERIIKVTIARMAIMLHPPQQPFFLTGYNSRNERQKILQFINIGRVWRNSQDYFESSLAQRNSSLIK